MTGKEALEKLASIAETKKGFVTFADIGTIASYVATLEAENQHLSNLLHMIDAGNPGIVDLTADRNSWRDQALDVALSYAAIEARATAAEERVRELTEKASAVLASWDERTSDREKLKEYDGHKFWSPSASMVESSVMAELRAAIAGDKP